MKLTQTSLTSLFVVRTFKIYNPSNFEVYNVLTIVLL